MKKLSLLVIFLFVSCSDTEFVNEQKVEEVVKYIKTEELKDNFTNLFCRTEGRYGGFRNTFIKFNLDNEKAYLFLDFGGKLDLNDEEPYDEELVENPSWVKAFISFEKIKRLRSNGYEGYDEHLDFTWRPSPESKKKFPNISSATYVSINRESLSGWRVNRGYLDGTGFAWIVEDNFDRPCKIITHDEVVKRIPMAIEENKEAIILEDEFKMNSKREQESKRELKNKI